MYLSPYRYLPEKPWMTLLAGAPRDAVTCIGCGCCSYVCPAELPLRRYVLRAKEEEQIRLNQRKKDAEQGNPPSDSSATPTATQSDNALPKNEQKGRDQQ